MIEISESQYDEIYQAGYDDGYANGSEEASGWAHDVAQRVIAWLKKFGDDFDDAPPDGLTPDDVVQALHDVRRAAIAKAEGEV